MNDIFQLGKPIFDIGKKLPSPIGDGVDLLGKVMSPANEPQRSYQWEMIFQDPFSSAGGVFGLQGYAEKGIDMLSGAIKDEANDFFGGVVDKVANYGKNVAEDLLSGGPTNLRYHVKATAIPPIQHENISRHVGAVGYSYVGRDQSPKILRCTLWDNQALEAYRFFTKWIQYGQYGDEKIKAHPVTYWRDIRIQLKDTSNLFTTQEFMFKGCFPTEITEAQLSYDQSDAFTFDVMFHFEKRVV
jgi:hypothetical protein